MTEEEVLEEFRASDALFEGHFILSSGRHSGVYLNKSLVFQYADRTERLCRALVQKVTDQVGGTFDLVVAPAVGAIIPGYEVGRALGLPALFVEREKGEFTLRRGFEINEGARVLMVEDIVTTGLSSRECIAAIQSFGGIVACASCIIDRSGKDLEWDVPFVALAKLDIPTYEADDLPPELASMPAVKFGSRGLK